MTILQFSGMLFKSVMSSSKEKGQTDLERLQKVWPIKHSYKYKIVWQWNYSCLQKY